MKTIKFSHLYKKMPLTLVNTFIIEILVVDYSELSSNFIDYDTSFASKSGEVYPPGKYPLPKGKLLLILLWTMGQGMWTTLRRWTPQKEKYYRSLIGREVKIEVNI